MDLRKRERKGERREDKRVVGGGWRRGKWTG